jgi:SAM-dependent methyltransferase
VSAEPGGASGFYDASYRRSGEREARWRELGALGKADHVQALVRGRPDRLVEIGCGDGALLAELARRDVAGRLTGYDVSAEAVRAARRRGMHADVFDGVRVPAPADAFDVAVLSHVLEHVDDPSALLREAARLARFVVVEVPLERSLSGRRASRRERSSAIGHVQSLDREAIRALVKGAGLRIVDELLDPLPTTVHLFDADTAAERAAAHARSVTRRTIFRISPALAARLFTLHYGCACTRS